MDTRTDRVSAANGFQPRRVDKPWGSEFIWALTDRYCAKIITIDTGRRLSLQYHVRKDEWVLVLEGRLRLHLEEEDGQLVGHELGPGEGLHVPVGQKHRFEAIEAVRLVEVSSPEIDDVVRLEDDYGREGTSAP
jgi:mannose-6-phosphate isomerase-like protein (cupin superfamily)